jgi:hypothetical protein
MKLRQSPKNRCHPERSRRGPTQPADAAASLIVSISAELLKDFRRQSSAGEAIAPNRLPILRY